jgi:hypothetical protein
VAVSHQQEGEGRTGLALHNSVMCITSLALLVTVLTLHPGLMHEDIQNTAIQTVMFFAGWTRGSGRLATSYQHHHWAGFDRAFAGYQRDGTGYGDRESMSYYTKNCPRVGYRSSHIPFSPPG